MEEIKNIVLIDVGTHKGQEIESFSNTSYFFLQILKNLIKNIFLKRKLQYKNFKKYFFLFKTHFNLKKLSKKMFFVTVEPNILLLNQKVYSEADIVFPFAIDDRVKNELDIVKLYIANNDNLSQGNSIYQNKKNINQNKFKYAPAISSKKLIDLIYSLFSKKELDVILRLNCEGSEDDLIYNLSEARNINLLGVLGSLKDINEIKGKSSYKKLFNFLEKNKIKFIPFSGDISTWLEAHKFIISLLIK